MPKKKNKEKDWKQDVDTDNELDIIEEWAWLWKSKGRDVGRWRQICEIREDFLFSCELSVGILVQSFADLPRFAL